MIYIIDTAPWKEDDVKQQCQENGVEFISGYHYRQTCTKLASILIKKHIADKNGTTMNELAVSKTGKPSFPMVQFNLTHHENIVVAVESAKNEAVGIDITDMKTGFTPGQQRHLWTLKRESPPDIPDGLYWAAREAYLKYTGEGVREAPLIMLPPAHSAFPDLETSEFPVMPVIRVEGVFGRCFRIREFIGVVIADLADLREVSLFSNEKT